MLRITIHEGEVFDESTSRFSRVSDVVVDFEHSLVSLSKWESIWQKPFLALTTTTPDEIASYIQCMVITPDFDMKNLDKLSQEQVDKIQAYMDSKESATTFGKMPEHKGPGETITSELIYFWMSSFNIQWEAQYWHLNRLFSLIRIHNVKNTPQKKRSVREMWDERNRLNEERKAKLGTRG